MIFTAFACLPLHVIIISCFFKQIFLTFIRPSSKLKTITVLWVASEYSLFFLLCGVSHMFPHSSNRQHLMFFQYGTGCQQDFTYYCHRDDEGSVFHPENKTTATRDTFLCTTVCYSLQLTLLNTHYFSDFSPFLSACSFCSRVPVPAVGSVPVLRCADGAIGFS